MKLTTIWEGLCIVAGLFFILPLWTYIIFKMISYGWHNGKFNSLNREVNKTIGGTNGEKEENKKE